MVSFILILIERYEKIIMQALVFLMRKYEVQHLGEKCNDKNIQVNPFFTNL